MQTTVMVGEKPNVASKLAQALGNYSVEENRGVKNYIIERDNERIIIAPAVGHIFNLEDQSEGWDYPTFDVEWQPIFQTEDNADYVKKYYNNLRDQLEKADEYINACDFDLEGCLHPDEDILIKKEGEIRFEQVGKLIDELIEEGKVSEKNEFEFTKSDLEVLGMDSWNTDFVDVEKVMRRPADENYLRITSFNGREVKVSKNHPMLVATENGLEDKRADQVEEGDYVLATKGIPSNQKKKSLDLIKTFEDIYIHDFKEDMAIMPAEMKDHIEKTRKQCLNYRYRDRMPKNIFIELEEHLGVERDDLTISSYKGSTRLPAKLELDNQLGRFIGLYLAEGCIDTSGFIGLYFGPEEDELVEEVREFLKEKIKTEGKTRKREVEGSYGDSECFEVGTKSKILRRLLEYFKLGDRSGSKEVPAWILSTPEEFREGVISGYWDGDGSLFIDKKDNRAIASAGSKSRELLNQLFYTLQAEGINASFQRWKERDMTNLTIGRKKGIEKLSRIVKTEKEFTEELSSTLSTTETPPMQMTPTCIAKRQGSIKMPSWRLQERDTVPDKDIDDWEEAMRGYKNGDTTFLEVKNIEKKQTEAKYFYDLQTSERNYQHGNGIISHNSVIGDRVIKELGTRDEERIKRMKFSTLTPSDLEKAFDDLEDFDHGMTEAGLTRHILDFYYGVNVSRALMQAVRENDRYKTLSTGRVQGPALNFLAGREREIQEFEPDPYWEIFLHNPEFRAKFHDDSDERIWEEDVATGIFGEIKGTNETVVSNIDINNYTHKPPVPFNLTGLQKEASSQFNINPKTTQSIAQDLYEDSLISYPRTESQKLPPKIGYKNILKKLKNQENYTDKAKKVLKKDKNDNLYTKQGSKEDDAHPAIYPTGQNPGNLSKQERKIYDLIVKRFFAVFGKPAKRQTLTMTLEVDGYTFDTKSKVTKERNWFELYDPYVKVEEAKLPDLDEGEKLPVDEFELAEKETQPPRRFSQTSIVSELEKRSLGTKATRAQVVDRLYDREFIKDDPIEVTDLGLTIAETLEEYSSEIVSEELTREFEEKMEKIKQESESRKQVLEKARDELGETLREFKDKEKEIGAELVRAIDKYRDQKRKLGPCDENNCDGTLQIIRTDNGRFVGCTEYDDCENTYPLPNNGEVTSQNEICEECGTPKIHVSRKSGNNYEMCIFPDCPTKDDW